MDLLSLEEFENILARLAIRYSTTNLCLSLVQECVRFDTRTIAGLPTPSSAASTTTATRAPLPRLAVLPLLPQPHRLPACAHSWTDSTTRMAFAVSVQLEALLLSSTLSVYTCVCQLAASHTMPHTSHVPCVVLPGTSHCAKYSIPIMQRVQN